MVSFLITNLIQKHIRAMPGREEDAPVGAIAPVWGSSFRSFIPGDPWLSMNA